MENQIQRRKRQFESVLNRPAPSQLSYPRPADVSLNIKIGRISRVEIRTALTQLKNDKAIGADNITSEAFGGGRSLYCRDTA